jgi:hypothetical protein
MSNSNIKAANATTGSITNAVMRLLADQMRAIGATAHAGAAARTLSADIGA